MSMIDDFITQYLRTYDYYREAARICARKCEIDLRESGIRAMVTYRAKRSYKLERKLKDRNREKRYKCFEDIYDDIVDLAGVRIALYFPGDYDAVDILVRQRFECHQSKEFPKNGKESGVAPEYIKRFAGYHATHYHVSLKEEELTESQTRYANAKIEIQVASVLMHAWAEVEHDLIYKPLSGKPSKDEHAILDELNGIVLASEIALERLQQAIKNRASKESFFSAHYDVAAFLQDEVQSQFPEDTIEPVMSGVDRLFDILELNNLSTPDSLREFIPKLNPEKPIVTQLEYQIDKMIRAALTVGSLRIRQMMVQMFEPPLASSDIVCRFEPQPRTLPADLMELEHSYLPKRTSQLKEQGKTVDFNELYGLKSMRIERPQQEGERRNRPELVFEPTNFKYYLMTNDCLDTPLLPEPSGDLVSIRQRYKLDLLSFDWANVKEIPLHQWFATVTGVITSDNQLVVAIRSKMQAISQHADNESWYRTSLSCAEGMLRPVDSTTPHPVETPSPFKTVCNYPQKLDHMLSETLVQ